MDYLQVAMDGLRSHVASMTKDIPDSGYIWIVLRKGVPVVAYPTREQAENYYGPDLELIRIPLDVQ